MNGEVDVLRQAKDALEAELGKSTETLEILISEQEQLDRVFAESVAAQKLRVAGYPRIEPKTGENAEQMEFTAIFEAGKSPITLSAADSWAAAACVARRRSAGSSAASGCPGLMMVPGSTHRDWRPNDLSTNGRILDRLQARAGERVLISVHIFYLSYWRRPCP